MNRRELDWLRQLERRASWLEKRVEEYQGKDPSYDKHEARAIRWAIEIIKEKYEQVERNDNT